MNDLDDALRAMLRERAADVTAVPGDLLDGLDALGDDVDPGRGRGRGRGAQRWTLVAAAVAAALVAGIALGVHGLSDQRRAHPAHPTPIPTRAPATTCTATLPAGWKDAISGPGLALGASAMPLAVAANGDVLAARDFGHVRDVVLVPPGGAPRRIFTVPSPDQNMVENASIEGKWAVMPVVREPRNSNGVLPVVVEVDLVDVDTRAVRTLVRVSADDYTTGAMTIDSAVIGGGHVYWDVRQKYVDTVRRIEDYDIASNTTSVEPNSVTPNQRAVGGPVITGWSVRYPTEHGGWVSTELIRPPSIVDRRLQEIGAAGVTTANRTMVSDGSSYAWVEPNHRIGWWGPGHTSTASYTVKVAAQQLASQYATLAVAGPFVFFAGDDGNYLLDGRTGAVAPLPVPVYLIGSHGIVVTYSFIGQVKNSPSQVLRIDTTALPGLHC